MKEQYLGKRKLLSSRSSLPIKCIVNPKTGEIVFRDIVRKNKINKMFNGSRN